MLIAGFSGALHPQSVCHSLTAAYLKEAACFPMVQTSLIKLTDIAATVGAASDLRQLEEPAAEAYQQILEADALIIAAPVSKHAYPGLFKHFFDLLDPTALRGKLALVAATGPTLYSGILDQHLRPLLDYFGLYTLPTDIYLPEHEFQPLPDQPGFTIENPDATARIRFCVQQLVSLTKAKTEHAA